MNGSTPPVRRCEPASASNSNHRISWRSSSLRRNELAALIIPGRRSMRGKCRISIFGLARFVLVQGSSIHFCPSRLFERLHKVETLLDLAEQTREISSFAVAEAGHNLPFLALQARNQILVEHPSLGGQTQHKFAAVVLVLDPLDEPPRHQRRDCPADGGFVRASTVRNILGAAGFGAKAKRGQHSPFRNVEAISIPVFAGKRCGNLCSKAVEAERYKQEQIQSRPGPRSEFLLRTLVCPSRKRLRQKPLQFELTEERARSLDRCKCDYPTGPSGVDSTFATHLAAGS